MSTGDEAQLLALAKSGNKAAFEQALLPHLPMLLAYCRAICGDFHTAQDAVQETALIAYRNLEKLFPEAEFAGWLKAIARLQALAARRKQDRVDLVAEDVLEAAYNDPSPTAVDAEQEALVKCLDALDERSRSVVRAHYFDGLRVAEIAAQRDLNLNTLKWLLFRARQLLQDCLQRRLGMGQA